VRRLSEADGESVLSRETAEQVGRLRHVVIDVPSRRIVALHVDGRRKKAQLVDWGAIVGFGPDSVIVDSERSLRPPAEGDELAVASGKLDLEGRLVLDERGDSLGHVSDIAFDEESGQVLAIVTDQGEHDAARLLAIGSYCVILRSEGGPPEASAAEAAEREGLSAREPPY